MSYAFNDDKSKFSLNPIEEDITNTIESIAPVESVVATANHAIGDYFMLGNTLMVATSAIAAGETITTSNATTATVQAQIDDLRNSVSLRLAEGINAVKRGGICTINVWNINGMTTWEPRLTLPQGWRPAVDVSVKCSTNNGANYRTLDAYTNGELYVYANDGGVMYDSITYVLA